METIAKSEKLRDHDALVVVVMSHGNKGAIEGTDDKDVPIDKLTEAVDASNCSALGGKPKWFIIQACQGGNNIIIKLIFI